MDEEKKAARIEQAPDSDRARQGFMILASTVVAGIVILVSFFLGDSLFNVAPPPESLSGQISAYLVPYLTCLAGVLLFIMNMARRKREEWNLRKYIGEHAFRVAQAFAYLLIVWWAWASVGVGSAEAMIGGTDLPPNIIGFLVGLFILRVERAMEGLGDRFEAVLMSVLPRSVDYLRTEERRRNQLRAVYRLNDIATQWEALRVQVDDLGARARIDEAIAIAQEIVGGDDPEKARKTVDTVSRLFEEIRHGLGETLVPVEDLIRE